jgi:hypothetical protein
MFCSPYASKRIIAINQMTIIHVYQAVVVVFVSLFSVSIPLLVDY